jgi:hypothetical protein
VPRIEIEVSDRIARHVASVRLMSYMVFPDNPELRAASEVTFRTQLADWYAEAFAKQKKRRKEGRCTNWNPARNAPELLLIRPHG